MATFENNYKTVGENRALATRPKGLGHPSNRAHKINHKFVLGLIFSYDGELNIEVSER